MSAPQPPRLIIADDNICGTGGHYFELANLLLQGGMQLGYDGVLVTNASFPADDVRQSFTESLLPESPPTAVSPSGTVRILPRLTTRRLIHWSLGVDGFSHYQRDPSGRSIGGNWLTNRWVNTVDRFRPKRSPVKMLSQWTERLVSVLQEIQPTPRDRILINTGDDFALLGLVTAMRQNWLPALHIDVLLHFAIEDQSRRQRRRITQLFRQYDWSLNQLRKQHDVRLYATTDSLANQFRDLGISVDAVPYPTRPREIAGRDSARTSHQSKPIRVIMAGLPRAEKGKGVIRHVLNGIVDSELHHGELQVSMQMPSRRWRRFIPPALREAYRRGLEQPDHGPLHVMTNNLAPDAYHDWLDTADLGLFLYDPDRYVARCSGVLLEMMVRGVPVIVPEGCWLADQVNEAGGHGTIGLIYRSIDEIPNLIRHYQANQDQMVSYAMRHANMIRDRHCGMNTLQVMGLKSTNSLGAPCSTMVA